MKFDDDMKLLKLHLKKGGIDDEVDKENTIPEKYSENKKGDFYVYQENHYRVYVYSTSCILWTAVV